MVFERNLQDEIKKNKKHISNKGYEYGYGNIPLGLYETYYFFTGQGLLRLNIGYFWPGSRRY